MNLFGLAFWAEILGGFGRVARRFPLSIVCGLACAIASSFLVDSTIHDKIQLQEEMVRLALTSGFGISLFVLTELILERLGGRFTVYAAIAYGLALLSLVVLYRWIPIESGENLYNRFWVRYLLFGVIVHLGISVAPFFRTKDSDYPLWKYNNWLFSKFLLTGFFSAVFYVGSALALLSIDKLFGADIDEKQYLQIWFYCAFLLNTCLFLSGFPDSKERVDSEIDYPKWILFLSKFILLPLIIVYFCILYAYTGKIVIGWSWPDGMVGLPVFILVAIGGLTALLVWPLGALKQNRSWANRFWRFFFPLIVPFSILLLLALQRRVSEYGFTEIRYIGIVLGFWILGISLFLSIRPKHSFRVIPLSLIAVCFIISIEPLSPSSIARKSQWNRFNAFLLSHDLLTDGILTPNPLAVDNADYKDYRSMIRYLHDGYGEEVFKPILAGMKSEDRVTKQGISWSELNRYQFSQAIIDYSEITSSEHPDSDRFTLNLGKNNSIFVEANTSIYPARNRVRAGDQFLSLTIHGEQVDVYESTLDSVFVFKDSAGQELAQLDFNTWMKVNNPTDLIAQGGRHQSWKQSELSFEVDLVSLGSIQVVAKTLNFSKRRDKWIMIHGEFFFLVPES